MIRDDRLGGRPQEWPDIVRGERARLADEAYFALRDDLIALRIQPGAPLDEKQLSVLLNVGPLPVRDAIKRLALERLVVSSPQRGSFAAEIDLGDETWLTETRIELEGQAALLASERATAAERATLVALEKELELSLSAFTSAIAVSMQDVAIHRAIYAAAHNPYLETALNQYANAASRIWHYVMRSLGPTAPRPCDQAEVVAAIIAGDGERARTAAEAHLQRFSSDVGRLLKTGLQVG